MDALHQRLLRIGFEAGDDLGLVLAGGYALSAHHLLSRPSKDIDFATSTALPLSTVVTRLTSAYVAAGFHCVLVEATNRMARLIVSSESVACEVDVLKEAIGPPAALSVGPVLSLNDAVGLKVRALHDRAAHRDYVDIRAANQRLSCRELETLGARHTPGFALEELADRLGGVDELDDETFEAYGLNEQEIHDLRIWALRWEADIRTRLASGDTGPAGVAESEWDAYLDEV
ncbi:nucleotidyl transferase AbiEii/AbiGii toxin family protein [Micromonospora siamensis]|uniref:Nucleotidyl transferase AbiEii toxin, Type IV TA system n=1 Tax=Micromonospora siamensis TaxID=299152 RepID=A0A1C5HE20_9ACTN|nr:nucleotidyl transferase AbiEii/AbiGii toxin family protein [Micromonospora siamensis]SCG44278.1 Nucleotidyl transferase AbiEii toxin, Type IV TA system [Micromonospora siamensis]